MCCSLYFPNRGIGLHLVNVAQGDILWASLIGTSDKEGHGHTFYLRNIDLSRRLIVEPIDLPLIETILDPVLNPVLLRLDRDSLRSCVLCHDSFINWLSVDSKDFLLRLFPIRSIH